MTYSVSISDGIAGAALLLSGFATWKTVRFNERQKSLIESQERLNNLLLEQGANEALDARKADLGANFIKLGSSQHRLKIWNKGKATAHNVRIEFPDGNDIVADDDVARKFPLEALEQFQPVELIAMVTWGSRAKLHIRLIWDDDSGSGNEKSIYATV